MNIELIDIWWIKTPIFTRFNIDKIIKIFERFEQKSPDKKYFKFINSSKNKRMMVQLEDILYCKADNNYTILFHKDASFLLSKTLRDIEARLPQDFFCRVHRSYVVNLMQVSFFDKDKIGLVLKESANEVENFIPVSATYRESLDKFYLWELF